MSDNGRIVKTGTNFFMAIFYHVVKVLMSFIGRTVFIYALGKEYLGLEGLFTSILSILNISELGIGAGIVYCLYKPLAENDTYKIQAYMNYYKKAYRIIGCVVGGIGIVLLPFVQFIVDTDTNLVNLEVLFLLYLAQSVSSYFFFAYKSSIFTADQKNSVISKVQLFVIPITTGIQIVSLLVFSNFLLYVCIGILGNVFANLFIALRADKTYPEVWKQNSSKLTDSEKEELNKKIKGLAMYKFSGTVITSTDNLIIASFLGTTLLGIYSNYTLLIGYVSMIPSILFNSVLASIGNVNAVESVEKKENVYNRISFFVFWLYCFSGTCILCLIEPFIEGVWLNDSFILSNWVTILLFINFVTVGLQQTIISYKDACGLFWEGRWRPIVSGALNLFLSVIFVNFLGIEGVILGTIVSRFMTTWWFDPWLVYKHVFCKKPTEYYIKYCVRFIIVLGISFFTFYLTQLISGENFLWFMVKGMICVCVPNLLMWIIYRNTNEFMYFVGLIKKIFIQRGKA